MGRYSTKRRSGGAEGVDDLIDGGRRKMEGVEGEIMKGGGGGGGGGGDGDGDVEGGE